MEILPILQGLSTPILLVIGYGTYRGLNAMHEIDKRLTVVEFELRQHRKTEVKANESSENFNPASSGFAG